MVCKYFLWLIFNEIYLIKNMLTCNVKNFNVSQKFRILSSKVVTYLNNVKCLPNNNHRISTNVFNDLEKINR